MRDIQTTTKFAPNYGSYDYWELSPDGKKAMIYGSEVWIVDIPQEN
jgi:hypothetical protein